MKATVDEIENWLRKGANRNIRMPFMTGRGFQPQWRSTRPLRFPQPEPNIFHAATVQKKVKADSRMNISQATHLSTNFKERVFLTVEFYVDWVFGKMDIVNVCKMRDRDWLKVVLTHLNDQDSVKTVAP